MKLIDSILIAFSAAFFLIGINEIINSTSEMYIAENYWIFMISLIFLIVLRMVRQRRKSKEGEE